MNPPAQKASSDKLKKPSSKYFIFWFVYGSTKNIEYHLPPPVRMPDHFDVSKEVMIQPDYNMASSDQVLHYGYAVCGDLFILIVVCFLWS